MYILWLAPTRTLLRGVGVTPEISERQTYGETKRGVQGPYTETIDLWSEPFFVKKIRRVIEWLREIKTADKHSYKFILIQQNKFFKSM
jgi:ribosomal protein L19E